MGVQTADLANSIAWYEDFLGCAVSWEMNQGFSALSQRRLPGLSHLVEVAVADIRLHLFTRDIDSAGPPAADANQFQHVCLRVATEEELRRWHRHWFSLYESGRYTFARQELASEIDIDADGMQSFYAYDVNGLEYEFTYLPDGADGDA
ncbi:VOC family protein [Micromonospora orduensis]|uniref:VOC family protein n=1 Tax=Micromonospora orduensis TaxID=1420891 RepID=A0A5C4QBJ4_9ACTN|nr:VOC family protein [Micromonospora orduensis]